MKKEIADRLIKLRGNRSREEVAKALDISISALRMYENGHRIPRDDIKMKIASYYNTTVQEIFYDGIPYVSCCSDQSTATGAGSI